MGGTPGPELPARHRDEGETMELVMLVGALLLVALVALGVRRHVRHSAWDRELEQAFGIASLRELPRHRVL